MTKPHQDDRKDAGYQLDIVALLDERFRLREDPERQSDLERTHRQLRDQLRRVREDSNAPTGG